jgi:hypothetical protein
MWRWLGELSAGQASFLGALTGSSIGLIALLLGALFNAFLNRRRDDRLRREDQRAVATALRAELAGLQRALTKQAESLKKEVGPDEGYQTSDLSQLVRIMPEMVPKFGLLDQETIQSVMNAYALLETYYSLLLTLGGRPLRQFSPQCRATIRMRTAAGNQSLKRRPVAKS